MTARILIEYLAVTTLVLTVAVVAANVICGAIENMLERRMVLVPAKVKG